MFFMSPTAENEAIKGTGQSKGINQKKTEVTPESLTQLIIVKGWL